MFESVLSQPIAESCDCPCGEPLGAYVVRGEYHSLCAPCTVKRVHALGVGPEDSPMWVVNLYHEVAHHIRAKTARKSWPPSIHCSACERSFAREKVRYHFPLFEGHRKRFVEAQRSEDGTVILFPENGIPEIAHPLCPQCFDAES